MRSWIASPDSRCRAGSPTESIRVRKAQTSAFEEGFKNADLALTELQVLDNIQDVQRRQNLPISDKLVANAGCRINLDVEMETGTGKTYCYIKTIFEMNKRYGWRSSSSWCPSIAIREGVYKSLEITAEHFTGKLRQEGALLHLQLQAPAQAGELLVGRRHQRHGHQHPGVRGARRRQPSHLRGAGRLPVAQAHRRDRQQPADPDSRRAAEDGRRGKTMEALPKFKPLMILRYSATHKTQHNEFTGSMRSTPITRSW